MSKKLTTLLILFLLLSIIFISLIISYSKNPAFQSLSFIKPVPAPVKSGQTLTSESTLILSPNPLKTVANETSFIHVVLESSGTPPNLIQLELAYNPNILANMTIALGDYFSNPTVTLNTINEKTGRISYALSQTADKVVSKQTGTVAVLTFTPRINAFQKETTISFLPKTMVRGKGETNTLKAAYGTKILLQTFTLPQASPSAVLQK